MILQHEMDVWMPPVFGTLCNVWLHPVGVSMWLKQTWFERLAHMYSWWFTAYTIKDDPAGTRCFSAESEDQNIHVMEGGSWVRAAELLKNPWLIVFSQSLPGGIWVTAPMTMVPPVQWPTLWSLASTWHDPSTLTVQAICHLSTC